MNLNIYTYHDDDTVTTCRRPLKTTNIINLCVYNNHFCYIKKMDVFTSSFKCRQCDKIFKTGRQIFRHEQTCKVGVQFQYPGGFYQNRQTVFEKLEAMNLYVPKKYRFHDYYIVHDFECLLEDRSYNDDDNTQYTKEHVPVSVSVASNIPGFEAPHCIVDEKGDVQGLIDRYVQYLVAAAKRAEEEQLKTYQQYIDKLDQRIGKKKAQFLINRYKNIKQQLIEWIKEIPVIGFNTAKYDLNAIKNELFYALAQNDQCIGFCVKKANSYMAISATNLKFIDIMNYLAPGFSYDAYIKAYDCKLEKGYFPYEWFDDRAKLNNKELPSHDCFFSSLKNTNITEAQYNYCQEVWKKNDMKTFKDFLIWYNNLDVEPFVEAIQKICIFYREKNLDLFKDGISVPGLVMRYLFQNTDAKFALFDDVNSDLYHTFKNNIVGGPSIIFNRYHEKNVTKIRDGKVCQNVVGYDANALYLWAMMQDMPTGAYERPINNKSVNHYLIHMLDWFDVGQEDLIIYPTFKMV